VTPSATGLVLVDVAGRDAQWTGGSQPSSTGGV
jgi:hypothetical protein